MSEGFGTAGDPSQDASNGTTNTEGGSPTSGFSSGAVDITAEDLSALRKRDENAQTHIQRLESENAELRDKYTEIETKLANATKIDDVMERITNQQGSESIDPDQLAEQVEQRLSQKEMQKVQENNWNEVVGKLTDKYGEWNLVDREISSRANQLGMTPEDATNLAKSSPSAFYQLFLPDTPASRSDAPTGAAGTGQTGTSVPSGETRDKAYYSKLRRENPNKYWSVEVQAQMRRDLFS